MPPNQPIPPVQQPDPNLDFTQQAPPAPQPPVQPVAPQPDPTITQLQTDITQIKEALANNAPTPPVIPEVPAQGAQPEYFNKKYDDWGVLEQDTKALVSDAIDSKLQEVQQQAQQSTEAATQLETQNQQYIDNTVGQLRQAGYLPPVTNQFDANDPGKQAENELLGYAIYGLGSTDLVKAAQELKFRHDAGFKYDYSGKQFVQVNQPSNDPNANMFGDLPQNPGQPQQFPTPPAMPPGPVGPQNPYMTPQYPAGFNVPVSSGNSFMGTQNGTPSLRNIRNNSYDNLVEQFNRTQ